eukprot:jgi/Hompol1/6299/HPOL_004922-RA
MPDFQPQSVDPARLRMASSPPLSSTATATATAAASNDPNAAILLPSQQRRGSVYGATVASGDSPGQAASLSASAMASSAIAAVEDDPAFRKRRASAFGMRKRSSSAASLFSLSASNDTYATGISIFDALDAHHIVALKRSALSPVTLAFNNPEDEAQYSAFFVEQNLRNWRFVAIFGILVMLSFQIAISLFLESLPDGVFDPLKDGLVTAFAGFLPLCIITAGSFHLSHKTLASSIHLLTTFYMLIVGPVLVCGRYFIQPTVYDTLTAPFFITIMFLSVVFFKVRFIYTLATIFISVPVWLAVSAMAFDTHFKTANFDQVWKSFMFAWFAISVFIASIVMSTMSYINERNHRLQYLSDMQFITINAKLQKQLRGLQSSYESNIADLDSPLEKAIMGVKALLCSHINGSQIRLLHHVLSFLTSSNLMAPDLYQQVKRGDVQVDSEQEKWLFTEIAARRVAHTDPFPVGLAESLSKSNSRSHKSDKKPAISAHSTAADEVVIDILLDAPKAQGDSVELANMTPGRRGSSISDAIRDVLQEQSDEGEPFVDDDDDNDDTDILTNRALSSKRGSHGIDAATGTSDHTLAVSTVGSTNTATSALVKIEDLVTDEVRIYMENVDEFNFPLFDFADAASNHPLLVMSHHLIIESGLLDRLQLPADKFLHFMASIEAGYDQSLAYHNSLHATDVLHGIHHLSNLDRISNVFSDLERLAIYVAASIHDYDHPGVNNNFLIATNDRRAMLYNDKSVLENHHCASAFDVMLRPENHFLEKLDRATYKSVRGNIVDMVLATDLAQHFSLLTTFKKKVVTGGNFDPCGSQEDRLSLMQMLMKCADVSNPTKAWPLYQEW